MRESSGAAGGVVGVGRRDTVRVWRQSFSEGWLGGRFPRGLCYRLGRMTSPRYQILNLLAPGSLSSTRYPNLPSAVPRAATNRPALTDLPRIPHRRAPTGYHRNLRLATISLSLYLPLCLRCLFVYNAGYSVARSTILCRAAISYRSSSAKIVF